MASASTLISLPTEVQREVLLRLDGVALYRLGLTCRALQRTIADDSLWRSLTLSRFRVSRSVAQSPRLLASGGATWRHLYTQWDLTKRMPTSRVSGPSFPALARGRVSGALAWVTVHSADDCRLVGGAVRLRVVVQNIRPGCANLQVHPSDITVMLASGQVVSCVVGEANTVNFGEYGARVGQGVVEQCDGERVEVVFGENCSAVVLRKDEFAVLRMHVKVPGANYEVDALERLVALNVKVRWADESPVSVSAVFREKILWDMYERLPGGSWVRSNPMSSHT